MPIPVSAYVYRARLVEVTDGDTIVATLSLGLHEYRDEKLRLLGVNCPEVHGATKAAGDAASAFTRDWLHVGVAMTDWPLVIETHLDRREKFGRLLARVWRVSDGGELNADLLAGGFAVPFMVGEG